MSRIRSGDHVLAESVNPIIPNADHHDLPDDSPESLRGIAERLKHALEELFAVKAEAEEMNAADTLPDDAQSSLAAARAECNEGSDVRQNSQDRRLYVPHSESWQAGIQSGAREYCSVRQPGEDWFHLLINGEIYLQFGSDKMCLNCAMRQGHITEERLFWQTGQRRQPSIFESPAAALPLVGTASTTTITSPTDLTADDEPS